jgi:hypothetical protein
MKFLWQNSWACKSIWVWIGSHEEYILPELSTAISATRNLSYFSSKQILRMIYFSYFHSILKWGIIFWGNSTNSVRVFKLQKKVIRIMSGMGPMDSCRDLFRKLQILPLWCEYSLSLMLFFINNQTKFCWGSDFHGLNTRNREQLYLPNCKLFLFYFAAYVFIVFIDDVHVHLFEPVKWNEMYVCIIMRWH